MASTTTETVRTINVVGTVMDGSAESFLRWDRMVRIAAQVDGWLPFIDAAKPTDTSKSCAIVLANAKGEDESKIDAAALLVAETQRFKACQTIMKSLSTEVNDAMVGVPFGDPGGLYRKLKMLYNPVNPTRRHLLREEYLKVVFKPASGGILKHSIQLAQKVGILQLMGETFSEYDQAERLLSSVEAAGGGWIEICRAIRMSAEDVGAYTTEKFLIKLQLEEKRTKHKVDAEIEDDVAAAAFEEEKFKKKGKEQWRKRGGPRGGGHGDRRGGGGDLTCWNCGGRGHRQAECPSDKQPRIRGPGSESSTEGHAKLALALEEFALTAVAGQDGGSQDSKLRVTFDSGATKSLSGQVHLFRDVRAAPAPVVFKTASSRDIVCRNIGDIWVRSKLNGSILKISDVYLSQL